MTTFAARRRAEEEESALLLRWKQFMATPVDAPRLKTIELVRLKPEALARRAHKFLTLAAEYNERARLEAERQDTTDPHRKWLKSIGFRTSEIETYLTRVAGRYTSKEPQ